MTDAPGRPPSPGADPSPEHARVPGAGVPGARVPVDRRLAAPDAALAAALEGRGGVANGELLTLEQVAEAAEVVPAVVEALVREGLLDPRTTAPDRWAHDDAMAVREGLRLVEAGVPLGELLALARRTDEGLRDLAEQAVDTFLRFVRDPVVAALPDGEPAGDEPAGIEAADDEAEGDEAAGIDAAQRLVSAFEVMLPATSRLLATHFERLVVDAARERIRAEAGEG